MKLTSNQEKYLNEAVRDLVISRTEPEEEEDDPQQNTPASLGIEGRGGRSGRSSYQIAYEAGVAAGGADALTVLGQRIMDQADRKGWNAKFTLERTLLNIHSEATEAWEHIRNGHLPIESWIDDEGKPDGFPIELIDILYRTIHTLAYYGINIEQLFEDKFACNEGRSWERKIA